MQSGSSEKVSTFSRGRYHSLSKQQQKINLAVTSLEKLCVGASGVFMVHVTFNGIFLSLESLAHGIMMVFELDQAQQASGLYQIFSNAL